MLEGKRIAVVVPAYNEEEQIKMVIESMPEFVDKIVIVDDMSKDATSEVVLSYAGKYYSDCFIEKNDYIIEKTIYNQADQIYFELLRNEERLYTPQKIYEPDAKDKIVLIKHAVNKGVGAAIASGYKWCRDHNIECTAVMAGDGQMDPEELISICMPVLKDGVDYVKGNRLSHKASMRVIPKLRLVGNSILSILTKIASGYWHISDTQTGYTAISLNALNKIDLHKIYKKYGMPNDLLVRLNIAYCTVKEVSIKPVYRVGEKSKMRVLKVIPTVSILLIKGFVRRLWIKYFIKDFHPLFLFYNFSFVAFILAIRYFILIMDAISKGGQITTGTYLGFILLVIFSFQSMAQAMSLDINDNERLYKYD